MRQIDMFGNEIEVKEPSKKQKQCKKCMARLKGNFAELVHICMKEGNLEDGINVNCGLIFSEGRAKQAISD